MKRLEELDTIRGLMILWMLIVHISLNYGFIVYGSPLQKYSLFSWMSFFMAPFFFFSGFCFKDDVKPISFLKKKITTLAFPYFIYYVFGGVIFMIFTYLQNGTFSIKVLWPSLSGMPFFNTPLWFFVTLFTVNLIYFILRKLPSSVVNVFVLFCFIGSWLLEGNRTSVFLMNRPIFLAIVYFHLGYFFRMKQVFVNSKVCVICIFSYFFINLLDQQCLWFVGNYLCQGHYPLNLIFSLCGIISLWYIFKNWMPTLDNNRIIFGINILGRYSLIIFATHRPILNYVYEPIIRYFWPSVNYFYFLFIGLCVLLGVSYVLFVLVRKIHPKLVGL